MNRDNFKKTATIYTVIFFAVIFLIGMVFFRKDDDNAGKNNLKLNNQSLVEDIKDEVAEEKKVKIFAENFTVTYYSYSLGNFSNIESQYYYMTDEMKNREKNKVEQMKNEIKNQARKYFTARARLIDSEFLYYKEAKANLKINLSIDNYAGAIVQRDTMVWVDEKGNYYGGDIRDLIVSTIKKKINIELAKIGDEWKVDEIGEVGK